MAATEQLVDDITAAAAVAPSAEPVRWATGVRRAAQVVGLAGAVLTLLLVLRLLATHGAIRPRTMGSELIPALLGVLVVVFSAAVVLLRPERGETWRLVSTSVVWSVALLVALAAVWLLIGSAAPTTTGVGTPLRSQADVDAYLAAQLPAADGAAAALPVPTGVLLQSVKLVDATSVQIDGYVWQTYGPTVPTDVPRGFVLPEALAAGYQADETFHLRGPDGTETIGWHVNATLPQAFDYRRYPFDRQNVALRIWQQDVDPRVLLVPDVGAYAGLDPGSLPGLTGWFVVGGWTPEYTNFAYVADRTDAPLDVQRLLSLSRPDLVFNLGVSRVFLGPYFDQVTFAIVVALLLFAVLCLTAKDDESKSRVGISTFGVLGTCSGLLFAVILKHSSLRQALSPSALSYIEVLPFLINLAIVLVALNAILLASPLRIRFVDARNNLWPDLLYWPVLLGLLLLVTLVVFYA